ncbi:MAG: PaaI family thioesterase [Promethearchaeota archaeon]
MPKTFPFDLKGFNPFCELIGLTFTKIDNGYSQCVLKVSNKLFNPHNVLHGGVIYSMADTGMGGALYTLLNENELCATIEVKINYFKAITKGNLICNTKVIHKGKKIAVIESEIINNDILVSKALGTYSIFEIRKN